MPRSDQLCLIYVGAGHLSGTHIIAPIHGRPSRHHTRRRQGLAALIALTKAVTGAR